MWDILFLVCIGLAAILLVRWAFRVDYAFVVSIEGGMARVSQGVVAPALVGELSELCGHCGVRQGVIRGIRVQNWVRLLFSRDIPRDCRQRIRNLWALPR